MTQPAGSHLDLDTVAALDEGLLGADAAAQAREHVAGCPQCSEEVARLRTTRALLSAMPPEQMPPDVAARVDAALAHAHDDPRPSGDVVPLGRRRRTWNTAAVAGVAAGIAVLGLVAAVVAGNVRSDGHDSSTADNAGGAASAPLSRAPRPIKVWSTGKSYTAATLAQLVPPLVRDNPPAAAGGGQTPATPSPAPTRSGDGYTLAMLQSSPAAVAECGRILSGGTGQLPLAVDFARFSGKPAAIFAFTTPEHAASLDVWVVRSRCSQSSLDYYFRRIPNR